MIQAVNQSFLIRFVARTIRFIAASPAPARPNQALPPLFAQGRQYPLTAAATEKYFSLSRPQQH
jgi:hypothetical protein